MLIRMYIYLIVSLNIKKLFIISGGIILDLVQSWADGGLSVALFTQRALWYEQIH